MGTKVNHLVDGLSVETIISATEHRVFHYSRPQFKNAIENIAQTFTHHARERSSVMFATDGSLMIVTNYGNADAPSWDVYTTDLVPR